MPPQAARRQAPPTGHTRSTCPREGAYCRTHRPRGPRPTRPPSSFNACRIGARRVGMGCGAHSTARTRVLGAFAVAIGCHRPQPCLHQACVPLRARGPRTTCCRCAGPTPLYASPLTHTVTTTHGVCKYTCKGIIKNSQKMLKDMCSNGKCPQRAMRTTPGGPAAMRLLV